MDPLGPRSTSSFLPAQERLRPPAYAGDIHDMLVVNQCPDLTPDYRTGFNPPAAARRDLGQPGRSSP